MHPWVLQVENQFAGREVGPGDTEWGHRVTVNFQTRFVHPFSVNMCVNRRRLTLFICFLAIVHR